MPASSRKRNKGKDRKAKQLAKKEEKVENERLKMHELWTGWAIASTCNHGFEIVIPADDHPVSSFMDQFYINLLHGGMTVSGNTKVLFENHTKVWNNESYRGLAIGILLRIGTNLLLREDLSWPLFIAKSIFVLEHYNGTDENLDSVFDSRVVISKSRDLDPDSSCIRRDVLKFYRKRATCKCLKKMHLEARKSTLKMGICWGCSKEMERVSLPVCSRCMVSQYCSRECQVAVWPEHEIGCDYHKQQMEMDDARATAEDSSK